MIIRIPSGMCAPLFAGLRSRELVYQIHKAHSRPVLIRWIAQSFLIEE
jgi:hypothetical protein